MAQADLVNGCRSAANLDGEKFQNSPLTKSSTESCWDVTDDDITVTENPATTHSKINGTAAQCASQSV